MAKIEKTSHKEIFTYKRGWGVELWIENLDDYCGKILFVDKGKRGSLHFHMNKLETMYLQSGRVQLRLVDPETGKDYYVDLDVGDSIRIPRGQVHQIIGVEDSELFEFSTKHEESDSYRVEKGD